MKSKRFLIGVCLVVIILSIGVYKVYAGDNQEIIYPKDFGYGVYYFSVLTTGSLGLGQKSMDYMDYKVFGRSLAKFKAEHPNLKVTGIASRNFDIGDFGYTAGYWVNFEEK